MMGAAIHPSAGSEYTRVPERSWLPHVISLISLARSKARSKARACRPDVGAQVDARLARHAHKFTVCRKHDEGTASGDGQGTR